jgi:hypothetical protein
MDGTRGAGVSVRVPGRLAGRVAKIPAPRKHSLGGSASGGGGRPASGADLAGLARRRVVGPGRSGQISRGVQLISSRSTGSISLLGNHWRPDPAARAGPDEGNRRGSGRFLAAAGSF